MRPSLLFLILLLLPISIADDSFKPYLHKAEVPDHPGVKLYGSYSTLLFPGAASYSYPIEVPKGTSGLQLAISISYNSQSAKGRPGILGAGWSLSQNYIYRDVNFTLDDTSDDRFKLVLNGASNDIVYGTDGYHTKTETFLRIQNFSTYWLVTSRDGVQYRFGYNADSNLASNTGRSYTLKWSLDQIEDTHGNKVFYTYQEDPNSEDRGSVYLSNIQYNLDRKREIRFNYETAQRPDYRIVYDQGNLLAESRRLSSIEVRAAGNLVRKYTFEYSTLNAENTLSSLSKIKYLGSDLSVLHSISFEYSPSMPGFTNKSKEYLLPVVFSNNFGVDSGIRTVDLNRDGFVDLIQGRESSSEKRAWLNNKAGGWTNSSQFAPPVFFIDSTNKDSGARLSDVNSDGFIDIIQANGTARLAFLGTGSGWSPSSTWLPPENFTLSGSDTGAQLVDVNGDGRVDVIQAKDSQKQAFLNNGSRWVNATSSWTIPVVFISSNKDTGARFEDVNGDGLPDIIQGQNNGTETRKAWLNTGSGWTESSTWAPPIIFTNTTHVDIGVRFADLNGDGLTDILEDYSNVSSTVGNAWINNGNGWVSNNTWQSPVAFTQNGNNIGRRLADVNGDGFSDILIAYGNNSVDYNDTWVSNGSAPFLLRKITNELGGVTRISYSASTDFDNTVNGVSSLGFNLFVVKNYTANNSLTGTFGIFANTSYNYTGGRYDYPNKEFVGFAKTTEFLPDSSYVNHYFHQDEALKGKEYRTEIYSSSNALFSRSESIFSYTNHSGYFNVSLLSQASYLYDGASTPRVTGINYTYDAFGNPIQIVSQGDFSIAGDEKYDRVAYVSNASAWIIGLPSRQQSFASDNVTRVRETRYWYDGKPHGSSPRKGDMTQVQQWLDGSAGPTTRYEYDSFGNVVRTIDPLGRETQYVYNLRDGTFTYADKIINPLGHQTDFAYDLGTGNKLWEKKNDITKYFYYDSFGRIIKEVEPYDSYELPTAEYTYSLDGNPPEMIGISQRTTANNTIETLFYYDGLAQFIQMKRKAEGNSQIVRDFFYDGKGNAISTSIPSFASYSTSITDPLANERYVNYTYDALKRVTRVTNADGTNKSVTFDRSTITTYNELGIRKAYITDSHGRITNVLEYNNDPVAKYNYEVDVYNTSYEYDALDKLVKITDALGNTFTYAYDTLGRKTSFSDSDTGNWSYTYDLAGNMVKQVQNGGGSLVTGDGYYREYDDFSRLIAMRNGSSSSSPIVEQYFYDHEGNRIKIKRNDSANTTIYTPWKELMRIVNSTGTYDYTYIYQNDVLVARVNPDGSKSYYHPDHLGSTSLITDGNGSIVEYTFYSPFGEVLGGGKADFKLYTGQFGDMTGQYYYGARYYKPGTAQFIQPDSVIPDIYDPQMLNRYAYVRNNPYSYTDESGNIVVPAIVAVAVGAGAVVGGINFVSTYVKTGDVGKAFQSGSITALGTTGSVAAGSLLAAGGIIAAAGATITVGLGYLESRAYQAVVEERDDISDSRALTEGLTSFGLSMTGEAIANSWWKSLTKGEKISLAHKINKFGKELGVTRLYRGIKNFIKSDSVDDRILKNSAESLGIESVENFADDVLTPATDESTSSAGGGQSSTGQYTPCPESPICNPGPNWNKGSKDNTQQSTGK